MKDLCQLVKKYPFSTLFVIVIWILSLMPIPETPLSEIHLIDKWTHIALYLTLSLIIAVEHYKNYRKSYTKRLFLTVFALPLVMGGLVEIIQATCTGGRRSGEWLDFAADGLGVLLALTIYILLAKFLSKDRKDN